MDNLDKSREEIDLSELLMSAIVASIQAGDAILDVYDSDFEVEHKDDNSPLTLADKRSHEVIFEHLKPLHIPNRSDTIPQLSEEGRAIQFEERKMWDYFWIIDPLDGTKEFVKRNGEFTVNIALVYKHTPILGVIYVPVQEILYFAAAGVGSYKLTNVKSTDIPSTEKGKDALVKLCNLSEKLPILNSGKKFTVVASRSHMSEETKGYIEELQEEHGEVDILSKGSSLKICMVAEGAADVYPRFGPTMEWDTAAGHAIAILAASQIVTYPERTALIYNKENLLNPYFLVSN